MVNFAERIALIKYHPLPLISLLLGIYGQYAFLGKLIIPTTSSSTWVVMHYIIFYFFYCSTILAQIGAIFKDPGYVKAPKEEAEPQPCEIPESLSYCKKCCILRDIRAHHCKICGRCVKKMDHHCPWICNCVGEDNLKYFLLFCFYTFWVFFYCLFITILYYAQGWLDIQLGNSALSLSTKVHVVATIVISLFFTIFPGIVLINSLWGIKTDETTLEFVLRQKLLFKKRCDEVNQILEKRGPAEIDVEAQKIMNKINVPRKANRPVKIILKEIMGDVPNLMVMFPIVHLVLDLKRYIFGESKQRSESLNSIKHL